jgi:acetate kinase
LGIIIDPKRNRTAEKKEREISTPDSPVKILVIPTNEELRIAQETERVIENRSQNKKTIAPQRR